MGTDEYLDYVVNNPRKTHFNIDLYVFLSLNEQKGPAFLIYNDQVDRNCEQNLTLHIKLRGSFLTSRMEYVGTFH